MERILVIIKLCLNYVSVISAESTWLSCVYENVVLGQFRDIKFKLAQFPFAPFIFLFESKSI